MHLENYGNFYLDFKKQAVVVSYSTLFKLSWQIRVTLLLG